jgi:5-(carboxyamino)imidazole ribonucleotide mutase
MAGSRTGKSQRKAASGGRPTEAVPRIAILMGSKSDLDVMRHAALTLREFGVESEMRVISAHRTPARLQAFLATAEERGFFAIIAAAGAAAHLAGVTAAHTLIPVLGVPLAGTSLNGMDALLSTVQMPGGIPVGTLAIGKAGAVNAALLAVAFLARTDPRLRRELAAFRAARAAEVPDGPIEA